MKFLNWIKSSLNICSHEWEDIDKQCVELYDIDLFGEKSEVPIKYKYIILQRCKKCGKYRTFKYNL